MAHGHLAVVLYSGIVVRRDAVSWSVRHKLEVLRRLIALGAPITVTCFAQSVDQDLGPELICCPSVAKLLARPEFWEADLHIYEEGMHYELFDSIHLVPAGRPVLAIEHNSTPVELVDVPAARAAVERSHRQRANLLAATHVACVSELNRALARQAGVPEDRLSVLHLPPAIVPAGPVRSIVGHRGPVHLLYLGRFVRAKGAVDMVALARRLLVGDGRFQVTMAGDPRFSDPQVVDVLQRAAAELDGFEVVLAPDDAETARLYERSHVLVVPSYHEGYCVPVVEAYGFGRFVVAYAAGNLPNVMGGLGRTVPVGDVGALEAALRRLAGDLAEPDGAVVTDAGQLGWTAWRDALARHLGGYSAASFERGFLALLRDLARASPAGWSAAHEAALEARLYQLDRG
jgi:glycosyltransferase involved in cell wall biosynthesis